MAVDFPRKESYSIDDLIQIMEILRGEDGCPWDREQTHQSIRKNFIEETYEVVEAIDKSDRDLLCEELGDVLLQVVFHARMEEEAGSFNFGDVCDGICKKLIVRHPHIFGNVTASTSDEVLANWDQIKQSQKGQKSQTETLRSVPKQLPALMRSEKVQHRAAKSGFDYPNLCWAFQDLLSEVVELRAAILEEKQKESEEELGDLLFSVVNIARFLKADPEESLSKSCEKFIAWFEQVEHLALERGIDMKQSGIDELNALWKEAKIRLGTTPATV